MAVNKQILTRVKKILPILKRTYPQAKCSLTHGDPLELLVATILSAQCTDERVNIVTKDLFKKYRSAADYAKSRPENWRKISSQPDSTAIRPKASGEWRREF
jgi:endonuclease III